ncbi:phosphatase PAP2 family protein [Cellulomonas sp.]|uniref:phosphatase PAP2 family protein n=1 Tax=Cellulomonas sp. TaxID=40001 RepID=UPI002D722280|nr:phosphatase PAP2 family protein [Cellulomonas sp.]HYQ74340.1 phosphatase PAP2 family protein [Cellulomonas sp.]
MSPEPWYRRAAAATRRSSLALWARRGEVRDPTSGAAVVIGLLLVVVGVVGLLVVHDAVAEGDDLAEADLPVLDWLVAARGPAVTAFLTGVSAVTGPSVLPVVVVAACLVWGLVTRSWWQPALLAGAMVLSTLVSVAIKSAVGRPRPPLDTMSVPGSESTYSFPSGHTVGTATFLLTAGYLIWIRSPHVRSLVLWALSTGLGIALVAGSRLYLGYHFLTDVIAGFALAVAVLGVVVVVDRRRAVRAARMTAGAGGDDAGATPAG